MEDTFNPFPTSGYISFDLFCDREPEIAKIIRNVENNQNTTIISPRRMGKTGLVFHLFEYLKREKSDFSCIYIDILGTNSLKDFIERLSKAILQKFPEKTSFGKKFINALKSFNPIITFDSITGEPQIQFTFRQTQDVIHTLSGLLDFLEKQNKLIIVAIDEFQQILEYPENNVEAILRSQIQHFKNTHFIFSGSRQHLMTEMFTSVKRPFFSSTQILSLTYIPKDKYLPFIRQKITNKKRTISDEALEFIAEWTRLHTYYTQNLCNRLFSYKIKNIGINEARFAANELLTEMEHVFFLYRNLLTKAQWNFLIAIAKEERLTKPQSKDFLEKYKIGTPASGKRALDALIEKEMVLQEDTNNGRSYIVYDCFLSRWMQKFAR